MRTQSVAGVAGAVMLAAAVVAAQQAGTPVDPRPANDPNQKPAFAGQTDAPEKKSSVAFEVVQIAEGLQNPWAIAFLPTGRMLVTERPGRLRVMTADGKMSEPVTGLPELVAGGQGGLLDVTLDPGYGKNGVIYVCFSQPKPGGANNTAVARGKFVDGDAPRLDETKVIYEQAPALNSRLHFGCRLVFGRDGTLFIAQGERSITEGRMQAQKLDGLLGKIVRVNSDGSIPKDNPFVGREGVRPEIWSFGHRNIQAAALNPATGELWEVEHGTRGGDEINIARKGKDYGWPTIAYGIEYRGGPITEGLQQKEGMEQPIYFWDPVIGPSGMAFYTGDQFPAWKGSLFVGGHATSDLVRLELNGEKIVGEERLLTDRKERIRDVRQGPDGALYLLTDAANGRLLKLVPRPGSQE
jgi:glucose/arabinose dehydrogenase